MAKQLEQSSFPKVLQEQELKRIQSYSFEDLEREQQRFTYFNIAQVNAFADRRLFFSNRLEIGARILILFSQFGSIILSYFFGSIFVQDMMSTLKASVGFFNSLNLSNSVGFGLSLMLVTLLTSLLIWLPMLILTRVGSLHSWSIFFIVAALGYFLVYEIFLICAYTLSGVVSLFTGSVYQEKGLYFIIGVFVITAFWLVGACLLLVKSDDVRRRIDVE